MEGKRWALSGAYNPRQTLFQAQLPIPSPPTPLSTASQAPSLSLSLFLGSQRAEGTADASLVGLGVLGGSWPTAMPGKLCTQNLTPLTFRDHGALKTLITEKVTQLAQAGELTGHHSKMKRSLA